MTVATGDGAYVREVLEHRAREQLALRRFPSVLFAVARHPLPIGETVRVGAGGDVPLPGLERVVRIEARADGFLVDGVPTGPRTLDAERYALRLSHQGYPALVVLDREATPREATLRWFDADPALRVRGRFAADGARLRIGSTASPLREAERVGWVAFSIDGVACRLAVMRLLEPGVPEDHLDAYFRDATTGRESYEVGRYAAVERVGGLAVVDFNYAYNPSCALSPYYNCPIPPPENRLAVPVRAGEMVPLAGPHP